MGPVILVQIQTSSPHCINRLLAALKAEDLAFLEPNSSLAELNQGQVLYEAGEVIQ